jgi:hypothetical protein
MQRPFLLVPVALFLGLSSCKKDPSSLEQLPAATQDGNNTAGWLLDGLGAREQYYQYWSTC